ncbi:hypothetical protein DO97_13440 [Neosynechococcus sphagnicola sy1]|uniref:Chloride channel protein n=1 Tax=Neosynechococcus sphagnicola sy1 TaxID=1497020 RepID=A0A098TIV9_9CYAN|nr:chloride channel protein [Neosynechococcus sphagnicola]KGF72024.1 hypothetical protein DO97_13440 [Neosynechococcus sphagnicola sy1]
MRQEPEHCPMSYPQLLFYAAGIGITVGFLSAAYYWTLELGFQWVWKTLPNRIDYPSWSTFNEFVWPLTTLGGLLVGLAVHYLGAPSGGLRGCIAEIHAEGRVDYRQTPGMIVASLLSLTFGSSAGPEAPLVDINGGFGTWLADRLKLSVAATRVFTLCGMSAAFGAFFGTPLGSTLLALEIPHRWGLEYYEALIPTLIAAIGGFAIFRLCTGLTIGGLYEFPHYPELQIEHLLYAILLGAIGAGTAILFSWIFQTLGKWVQPLTQHPVILTTLGGLAIGLIATVLPLTLFYGERQIQTIIDLGERLGSGLLLLIALAKMVTLSISVHSGFRGGILFPLFFMGATVGMAVSLMLPQIPPTVGMICTMAALSVAILKTPMGLIIVLNVISHTTMMPLITVATTISLLLTAQVNLLYTKQHRTESHQLEILPR